LPPALGERPLSGARLDCRKKKCFFFTLARCRIWTRRCRTRRQRAKPRRLLDSSWFGVPSHARSQGTAFSSGSIEGRRRLYSRAQVRVHASSVGAKRHPSRDDRKKCWGKSRQLIDTVVDKSRVSREPMRCDGPRRVLPASCGGPGQSWLEFNAGRPRVRSLQPSRLFPLRTSQPPKSLGGPVRSIALWKD
jgi:hypothetical protein